jgi:hypothetical protein
MLKLGPEVLPASPDTFLTHRARKSKSMIVTSTPTVSKDRTGLAAHPAPLPAARSEATPGPRATAVGQRRLA